MKRFLRKHGIELGIVLCVMGLLVIYITPKFLRAQNINTPENFPDPNFRKAIQEMMGVEPGERITLEQAYAVTDTIFPRTLLIEDITGIEYFPNIKELNLRGHMVRELQLSGFHNLEELICPANALTELDLSDLPKLKKLNCRENQIKHLDVSHNPLLEDVNCQNNLLESITFGDHPNLHSLDVHNNSIQKLDPSNFVQLKTLNCDGNLLKQLDVSKNHQLQFLYCCQNDLEELILQFKPTQTTENAPLSQLV